LQLIVLSCLSLILSNGDAARFCNPAELEDGWSVVRSDAVRSGFVVAEFVLEKRGAAAMTVRIHEMPGTTIAEAERLLRHLAGKKRGRFLEVRRLPSRSGFVASFESSRKLKPSERKVAEAFLERVEVDIRKRTRQGSYAP
jgi:hypothetical protein